MANDLLARMPAARLDAMNGSQRRKVHAERVSEAARRALAELAADVDRHDLARLLAAIGDAWATAVDLPNCDSENREPCADDACQVCPISMALASAYFAEQMRWSRTCIIAEEVAMRWRGVTALTGDGVVTPLRGT